MEKKNTTQKNAVGIVFKNSRQHIKLTQEQLAEKVGISTRYIMGIENEGKRPSFDVFTRLIRTLNISADTIVYPELQKTSSEDEQLVRALKMLNTRDKKIIKSTIETMLNNL